MKFFDFKCECGFKLIDVPFLDGENVPKTKKCPKCGKFAPRAFGAIPMMPQKHQAVTRK